VEIVQAFLVRDPK